MVIETNSSPAVQTEAAFDPALGSGLERLGSAAAQAAPDTSRIRARQRGSGIALDTAGLAVAIAAAAVAQAAMWNHRYNAPFGSSFTTSLLRLAACLPLLVAALYASRRRTRAMLRVTVAGQLRDIARPLAAGGLACLAGWRLLATLRWVGSVNLDAVLLTCAFGLTTVTAARSLLNTKTGSNRRVLILGTGMVAQRVATQLLETGGIDVVGFLDDDPKHPSESHGPLADLVPMCQSNNVDHVIVAFTRSAPEAIIDVLRPIEGKIPITVVPRLFDVLPDNANLSALSSSFPGITVGSGEPSRHGRMVKRSIDLVASSLGLLAISPLLLAIAVSVKVSSPGPILFRQTRVGLDGGTFSMFKFRTMVVQDVVQHPSTAPADLYAGPFPKPKSDPRITHVGASLRHKSLDELPQLFNVFLGTMSLVGPRPFPLVDDEQIVGWDRRRYTMPPGITGLWQISGRNDLTFEEMARLDQLYVNHWSVLLDLRILFRTVRVVASGRGAY